ncbi:MAG TPA: amidohydrolase family protein, partial [Methylomirabilota bacterium]|nr:amidohydrolase family protein [Methylomirabilota bacterium]
MKPRDHAVKSRKLAARKSLSKPKPRPTVDIHSHFVSEAYLKLIEDEGPPFGVSLSRSDPEGPAIVAGASPGVTLTPDLYDPDLRIRAMNKQNVQIHALSLTDPMVYPAQGSFGAKLARTWNDSAAEMVQLYPNRFVGLATLPMQDPVAAVDELHRAVTRLGCRGVYLGTNVRGKELADPSFLPVLERINALKVPVFLHPTNVIGRERLAASPYYLHNLLGNPFDTAVAAATLIFAGILDRYPRLEICLPHAGGALPYLIGRVNHGWKVRPECKGLPKPPLSYLRRFTYDTISHSPEALRYLVDLVGADRVMVG